MIGQLNELILYAQDMAAQLVFYRDVLGFRVLEPEGAFDARKTYWILLDTGACKLALHGGGERKQGADAPKFVFGVEDIEATHVELLKRGVAASEIRTPAPGVRVIDCKDPEGNRFSFESRE